MKTGPASSRQLLTRILPLICLVIFTGITIASARWLMAEEIAFGVKNTLAAWDESPETRTTESWTLARDGVNRALALKPLDPAMHVLKRQVYVPAFQVPWLASDRLLDLQRYYDTRNDAADTLVSAMRQAAELTPASPYAWIDLANAKTLTSQYDDEFTLAFANAYHYGQSVDTVQVFLARLSASHPYALNDNPRLRPLMLDNLYNTLARNGRTQDMVISALRQEYAVQVFCSNLDQERLSDRARSACSTQ